MVCLQGGVAHREPALHGDLWTELPTKQPLWGETPTLAGRGGRAQYTETKTLDAVVREAFQGVLRILRRNLELT
eukprot:15480353-Alexandrium_andersonii.AAC.1